MSTLNKSIAKRKTGIVKRFSQISMVVILVVVLALVIAACGGQDMATQEPVTASWITPLVSTDTVSIPVSQVDKNTIVHFKILASGGELTYMAYEINGKLNIRANVCPPCRSIGFSLSKATLICDTCKTTFEARTGEGIAGACVNYPKAEVTYELNNGMAVMSATSLISAYLNTIEPGQP